MLGLNQFHGLGGERRRLARASWNTHVALCLLPALVMLASAPLQAQQPVITAVGNAASYAAGGMVPGSVATLFGTGIVSAPGIVGAPSTPLPTVLGGTQVLVNNIPAPLFAVANLNGLEQVNFQVPWEVAGATKATVVVVNGSARSASLDVALIAADPGLFMLDGANAIVVHGITNQLVTATDPAAAGEVVVFYATGLGAVDHAQQSGQPASLTELAKASNALSVSIGGQAAAVQFAGLTPGSIGLFQVNCTVPAGVIGELEVLLTMLGRSSKAAKIPVRGAITGPKQGTLTANPNPIVLAAGQSSGKTTLTWLSSGVTAVQIWVNSSTGTAVTGGMAPNGSMTTDSWVTNGMKFFLQDNSTGDSSGDSKTLATVTVATQASVPVTPVPTDLGGGVKMEFVSIPAGEFMMGCSPGDTDCDSQEKPLHKVQITKSFEMGKYEATQGQWQAVMGSSPSRFQGSDRPVETVSWNDIQDFLTKLNARKDGYRYRLPTEAEWEYAARAGTTGPYYGNLDAIAWNSSNSGNQTHPVGQKAPNAWGLYDMFGNVWEGCQDWFDSGYYSKSPAADPPGAASGSYKVFRGGGWGDTGFAGGVRVSARIFGFAPGDRYNILGFRCVRER